MKLRALAKLRKVVVCAWAVLAGTKRPATPTVASIKKMSKILVGLNERFSILFSFHYTWLGCHSTSQVAVNNCLERFFSIAGTISGSMFKYKFLGALPTHSSEYPFRINEVLHYINSWLKDIDAVKKQGKTGPYSPHLFEAGIESLRIAENSYSLCFFL
jgi:hypothetical protein